MSTHNLEKLLHLVDTAYYQQDGNKAVCEVLGKTEGRTQISLFVNGAEVHGYGTRPLEDVLRAHNLNTHGWTTKP